MICLLCSSIRRNRTRLINDPCLGSLSAPFKATHKRNTMQRKEVGVQRQQTRKAIQSNNAVGILFVFFQQACVLQQSTKDNRNSCNTGDNWLHFLFSGCLSVVKLSLFYISGRPWGGPSQNVGSMSTCARNYSHFSPSHRPLDVQYCSREMNTQGHNMVGI